LPVAAGRVHKRFVASDGRRVTLRAAKWDDLDAMTAFARGLVEEQRKDPTFGTLIDGPVTREKEARWLADKLVAIESGKEVSVVAEVGGRVVANSEVVRGKLASTDRSGYLAISVSLGYRGMGIGSRMMECLIGLSREAGMKTLELHVLATNPRAFALYEKIGFKKAGVLEKKVRRGGKAIDVTIMTLHL
jgi:ribosomal protein S18 acetylase RimI-like enzyme